MSKYTPDRIVNFNQFNDLYFQEEDKKTFNCLM